MRLDAEEAVQVRRVAPRTVHEAEDAGRALPTSRALLVGEVLLLVVLAEEAGVAVSRAGVATGWPNSTTGRSCS